MWIEIKWILWFILHGRSMKGMRERQHIRFNLLPLVKKDCVQLLNSLWWKILSTARQWLTSLLEWHCKWWALRIILCTLVLFILPLWWNKLTYTLLMIIYKDNCEFSWIIRMNPQFLVLFQNCHVEYKLIEFTGFVEYIFCVS